MAIHLRRPGELDLDRLLERCNSDSLTYEPVGRSLGGATPLGLTRREWSTPLVANDAFARASQALAQWKVQEHSGLTVRSDGPLAVGTNVALIAPLPVGYIDATCRVVAVVDEPDRFGFAYGTLSIHPEQGEEAFIVFRQKGQVTFVVASVSRSVHRLSRLLPPVAHRLQAGAARRYLQAMERLTLAA